jgi:dolichol-phosphate mannosyltransferase
MRIFVPSGVRSGAAAPLVTGVVWVYLRPPNETGGKAAFSNHGRVPCEEQLDRMRDRTNDTPRVSVAVPLYNEEQVLPELLRRSLAVLDRLPGGPHEMICVDDGSSDRTLELLKTSAAEDPRIVAISFSRNFGHQAAISAGLEQATGDAVVLMDGDLQDTPESIPKLLDKYRQGYDVVYVVRVNRKEGRLLRLCYYLFYHVITALAELRLPRGAGDFCLMSRRVVDELTAARERHTYLRGLRSWVGFRQIGVEIERAKRGAGQTKYNLRRLLGLAFDGIFSFSTMPLRAATVVGGLAVLTSICVAAYAVYGKFFLNSPQGFTALIVSVTFFAGVQLVVLGVIGEYIGRIYEETKGRPRYIVDEVIGSSKTRGPNASRHNETTARTSSGDNEIDSS